MFRIAARLAPAIVLASMLLMRPASTLSYSSITTIPGSAATTHRLVALTFDYGPSIYTPRVLDVLRAFRAHATFFVIGRQVGQYPGFVREVVDEGDEVGNHTYTHADLLYLSDDGIKAQLEETQHAVKVAAGVTPVWFRPPEGAVDSRVAAVAASLDLHTVLWSVDPRDWSRPGTGAIVQNVLAGVRPGSIILLHDGGGDRSETLAALPVILRTLQAQHFQVLTVSQLFRASESPPCDSPAAARWFASAGIPAEPSHAIYRAWLELYCRGDNFGPATSSEYTVAPGTVVQDFSRTGHRLVWNVAVRSVGMEVVWSWPMQVFAGRGIQPRWHTAITHAWFEQYFDGYDWGPALEEQSHQGGATEQCFLYGCAVARGPDVTWHRR